MSGIRQASLSSRGRAIKDSKGFSEVVDKETATLIDSSTKVRYVFTLFKGQRLTVNLLLFITLQHNILY